MKYNTLKLSDEEISTLFSALEMEIDAVYDAADAYVDNDYYEDLQRLDNSISKQVNGDGYGDREIKPNPYK